MSELDPLTLDYDKEETVKEGQMMTDKLIGALDNRSHISIENEAHKVANSTVGVLLSAPRKSVHFCIMCWFPLSVLITIIAPFFALLMYCYESQPFAFDFQVDEPMDGSQVEEGARKITESKSDDLRVKYAKMTMVVWGVYALMALTCGFMLYGGHRKKKKDRRTILVGSGSNTLIVDPQIIGHQYRTNANEDGEEDSQLLKDKEASGKDGVDRQDYDPDMILVDDADVGGVKNALEPLRD